ncbi:MAG: nickel-dependent lactate racemase [Thermodesulfobacteriota bacterium]
MTEVELLSAAWYGDNPITITFPSSWEVFVVGTINIPPLTDDEVRERFYNPIGVPRLSVLASKRNRVAIVIDDITRPTPTARLIPFILEELKHAGINDESIIIVVASGTHTRASEDDIIKKVGESIVNKFRVSAHDCRRDLVYLGKSLRGTPLFINQAIMECDLKIGVGCIYPHGSAGFAGGSKILMPGVCGIETVRYMHSYLSTARKRGGSLENDLRLDIEEVAGKVGLDFIINVVLGQKREIAGLFTGDKILAHREGVKFATELYSVSLEQNADIVVSNMYPFDTSLQYVPSRGFWPLLESGTKISKVAIAACPMGLGYHGLAPLSRSIKSRFLNRLKYFDLKEFKFLFSRLMTLKKVLMRQSMEFMMLSQGITKEELKTIFPKAKLFSTWGELLNELEIRHKDLPVKVAVYPFSPLQIPMWKSFNF